MSELDLRNAKAMQYTKRICAGTRARIQLVRAWYLWQEARRMDWQRGHRLFAVHTMANVLKHNTV